MQTRRIHGKLTVEISCKPHCKMGRGIRRLLAGQNTALGEPNAEMLRKLRAVLATLTEADLERIDALRAVFKDAK